MNTKRTILWVFLWLAGALVPSVRAETWTLSIGNISIQKKKNFGRDWDPAEGAPDAHGFLAIGKKGQKGCEIDQQAQLPAQQNQFNFDAKFDINFEHSSQTTSCAKFSLLDFDMTTHDPIGEETFDLVLGKKTLRWPLATIQIEVKQKVKPTNSIPKSPARKTKQP